MKPDKVLKNAQSRIEAMRIAAPAGPESSRKAADEIEAAIILLKTALQGFASAMNRYGNWEDGCFYYNNRSASELADPIKLAEDLLR